ncbi:MAG TPA: FGGY family carbohydrate kinase, partial [Planctomycetota bacterium]|nr:FGGY family carbohydrate kinase [Planctomycetota bacterium]
MSLLGIEIADERVSAGVFDIEGRLAGRGESSYAAERPGPGRVEVWMDRVWDALTDAVKCAASEAADPVTAMSLAVRGDVAVAVDRDGNPLAPSVLPEDTRSDDVARDFQEKVSPIEVMRVTGMPMGAGYPLLRLLWLREHDREVYRNTWKFMGWQDWVVSRLGAEPTTDPSLAGRTQMFDIINGVWADEILDAAGIDRDRLSEVRPAGTLLGEISRTAADALGLPAGTKLVLGGEQQAVAALGVGAAASGHALNCSDAAEHFVPAFHEPVVDVAMMKNGFSCTPHVVPEMFVSRTLNPTGGRVLDWYRHLTDNDDADGSVDVETLVDAMDDAPTDLMVLPYFGASGTPYHETRPVGTVAGLSLETRRGTLLRALLEGLALETKLNTALLAES